MTAATQVLKPKFVIHYTAFSQDCSAPLSMIDGIGEAVKEAKCICNNIVNVTVLTAKFKQW